MKQLPEFFLGANSRDGFISYFNQLQESSCPRQLLILKGGPGSGKSTLMKRVLKYARAMEHTIEVIPCASDPASLDAVIDYTANFAIMDGTSPHTLDPLFPGARHHIMYTGDMWDSKKLRQNSDSIEKLTQTIGDCHKGARSYINAASALLAENIYISSNSINKCAASEIISEIASQIKGCKEFREKKRLLSAVSIKQIKVFRDTPSVYCDKIYVINDRYGGFADYILKKVYEITVSRNENIILCPCSLDKNKIDHIILPESHVAILKENDFMKFDSTEKIMADDFYSFIPMSEHMEKRIKNAAVLLSEAGEMIADAKFLHDELEAFYVSAMDFSRADGFFSDIVNRFYN